MKNLDINKNYIVNADFYHKGCMVIKIFFHIKEQKWYSKGYKNYCCKKVYYVYTKEKDPEMFL